MAALAMLCGICGLIGVIWIAVIAFQDGEVLWGVLSILCGIVAIVYGIQHMPRTKIPLILLIVGVVGNVILQVGLMR